ncbi:MAG: Ig-like domain-containing protein, partial [Clostridiales bacterium]|nr:Ig-like domain-containing protein [Clostridiales bacterium]
MKISDEAGRYFKLLGEWARALSKKKYFPHFAIGIFFAAAVVILAIFQGGFGKAPETPVTPSATLDIKPLSIDGNYCIPTDAAFLISLSEPVDENQIGTWLKVSPQFDYNIEKTNNPLEYKLKPKTALTQNTVYSFCFDPVQTANNMPERAASSFAFQTQNKFAVSGSHPGDKTTGVPVNSAIELKLTSDVNIDELTQNVTFEPQISGGKWDKTDVNTYTFIPDKPFSAGTTYKVTINGALQNSTGDSALGEDYTVLFETRLDEPINNRFYIENNNNAFMYGETPVFKASFNDATKSSGIKIYSFKSIEDYAKALDSMLNSETWGIYTKSKIDTSMLKKVFDSIVEVYDSESWYNLVVVPEILPKGFYAAEFSTNGYTDITLFQVTDLSAYAMRDQGSFLFWVNDLRNQVTVAGAEISEVGGRELGAASADGILAVKNNLQENRYSLFQVKSGEEKLL